MNNVWNLGICDTSRMTCSCSSRAPAFGKVRGQCDDAVVARPGEGLSDVADEGLVAAEGDRLALRGVRLVDVPPLGQRLDVDGAAGQSAPARNKITTLFLMNRMTFEKLNLKKNQLTCLFRLSAMKKYNKSTS